MTASADLLPRLAAIIAGWERAEGIRVLQAWVTDGGTWLVEWTEKAGRHTDTIRGGENHIKVSRLIDDLKEALKQHSVDARHISQVRPGALRAWTGDGQYLRWDLPASGDHRWENLAEGLCGGAP
jgi:hypothetical protein